MACQCCTIPSPASIVSAKRPTYLSIQPKVGTRPHVEYSQNDLKPGKCIIALDLQGEKVIQTGVSAFYDYLKRE